MSAEIKPQHDTLADLLQRNGKQIVHIAVDEATLRAEAERLIREAEAAGLVLTIEQRPLQPLRMGNYESVVSVRKKIERNEP